ncbi:MAG: hypothetical protein ACTHJN_01875 [Ginsengibacter sp.]
MKTKILILIMATMFGANAMAQQNKFTLGFGYQRTWMLDKQASPLKYQTSEKTILLGFDHKGNKGILGAQINGALGDFFPTGFKGRQMYDPGYNEDGTPKKDSSYMPGTLYSGRIIISYLRKATSGYNVIGKEQLYSHNYYGASVNNQLFYSDNIVRTGWLNSASLNGEFMHTAMLNTKHFFNIKISIPLFAENTRLPYHNTISSPTGESNVKTFFRQGSRFAWFGNFQNIQLDASYEYSINDHWSMGLRYFGQWLHYSKEKPINLFQNNIGITTSLK